MGFEPTSSSTVEQSAVVATALFAGLGDHDAAAAAARLRKVVLLPEQALFREGEPGDSVFLLVAGEMAVIAAGDDAEHQVASLDPGSILGYLGLLAGEPRSATVVARTPVELWEMSTDGVHAALEAGEVWAGRVLLAAAGQLAVILRSATKRLVTLIERVGDAPTGQPAGRMAELEELRTRLLRDWSF